MDAAGERGRDLWGRGFSGGRGPERAWPQEGAARREGCGQPRGRGQLRGAWLLGRAWPWEGRGLPGGAPRTLCPLSRAPAADAARPALLPAPAVRPSFERGPLGKARGEGLRGERGGTAHSDQAPSRARRRQTGAPSRPTALSADCVSSLAVVLALSPRCARPPAAPWKEGPPPPAGRGEPGGQVEAAQGRCGLRSRGAGRARAGRAPGRSWPSAFLSRRREDAVRRA